MNFLEKLNYLMEKNHLNKNTLSKACNIPYTTIDGWYKKGYEGLKLTTLKKLAEYFGTSLDYWASEDNQQSHQYEILTNQGISLAKKQVLESINTLSDEQVNAVSSFIKYLTENNNQGGQPPFFVVFKEAHSADIQFKKI